MKHFIPFIHAISEGFDPPMLHFMGEWLKWLFTLYLCNYSDYFCDGKPLYFKGVMLYFHGCIQHEIQHAQHAIML